MRINKTKIIQVIGMVFWMMIGASIVTLLVSAIKKETSTTCKEVIVTFNDKKNYRMLNEQEIFSALWPSEKNQFPTGKQTKDFDLYKLEKQLEKNPWVLSADLYFDQNQALHIDINQREPIARVFTPTGNSYYMDNSFFILPVKSNDIISLPVFTNFYFNTSAASKTDSAVLQRVASLSNFILADSFWAAQVEAINIKGDNSFEMTPQVGNQIILLGDRSDWQNVFGKLKSFYQYINAENEWGKYSKIDLQFKDQIVCVRNNGLLVKSDSLAAQLPEKKSPDSLIEKKSIEKIIPVVNLEKPNDLKKSITTNKPKALMPAPKNKKK
jgi:cell division protein FtsQ